VNLLTYLHGSADIGTYRHLLLRTNAYYFAASFVGKHGLACCPGDNLTKSFVAKFYRPDALPDASQNHTVLHPLLHLFTISDPPVIPVYTIHTLEM